MTEIDQCTSTMSPATQLAIITRSSSYNDFFLRHKECSTLDCLAINCERLLIVLFSTFLKRKGGLFKKAHELSVLCSVDVAVIIFGHNKKLYEYSSGDINETIGRFQYVGATN